LDKVLSLSFLAGWCLIGSLKVNPDVFRMNYRARTFLINSGWPKTSMIYAGWYLGATQANIS
jgi:hypothetical protein